MSADIVAMDFTLCLLAAYVLGGSVWPQIVRSRSLFLYGFAAVAVAMLLEAIRLFFFGQLAEVAAFVLLVQAASGATIDQFWRELRR